MHKVLALLAALGAAEHVVPHGYDGDAAAAAPLADGERLRELASQQRVLHERVAELERLAFDGQGNPLAPEETSLLEQFGVSAREFLVHRLSPRTDPECRWHYAKARCAPICTCGFHYKFGDYTLSRACRLLPSERIDPACDPRSIDDEAGAFEKLSRFATRLARDVGRFLDEAAPRTDAGCRFSLGQMQCEPSERCALRYRFGDFSPGRACRLRDEPETLAHDEPAGAIAASALPTSPTGRVPRSEDGARDEAAPGLVAKPSSEEESSPEPEEPAPAEDPEVLPDATTESEAPRYDDDADAELPDPASDGGYEEPDL